MISYEKAYGKHTIDSRRYAFFSHCGFCQFRATLAELPEDDLSFTLYAHEKITLLDKIQGKLWRSSGYFTLLLIDAIAFLIIGIIIVMLILRRKKNKYI